MAILLSVRVAAVAATGLAIVIAAFQVAVALGAPVGRAAWGGTHVRVPTGLRIASAFAVGVWLFIGLIILARAGFAVSPLPYGFATWGTWVLVGLLPAGALMNFVSRSMWERLIWGPVALIMAVLCFLIARSDLGQ